MITYFPFLLFLFSGVFFFFLHTNTCVVVCCFSRSTSFCFFFFFFQLLTGVRGRFLFVSLLLVFGSHVMAAVFYPWVTFLVIVAPRIFFLQPPTGLSLTRFGFFFVCSLHSSPHCDCFLFCALVLEAPFPQIWVCPEGVCSWFSLPCKRTKNAAVVAPHKKQNVCFIWSALFEPGPLVPFSKFLQPRPSYAIVCFSLKPQGVGGQSRFTKPAA